MFLARTQDQDLLVKPEENDEEPTIKPPENLDPTILREIKKHRVI